jgi:hypothetical protein
MLKRTVVVSLMLAASMIVSAAQVAVMSTLTSVYPLSDGSFILNFTNDASTTCTSPNTPKYFYVMPGQNGVTVDGAKAMLATALTAFAMGKSVSASYDDATIFCYINRFSIQ